MIYVFHFVFSVCISFSYDMEVQFFAAQCSFVLFLFHRSFCNAPVYLTCISFLDWRTWNNLPILLFLVFLPRTKHFFCFTFISYATHYFPALYLPLHNVISFIFLNTFYLLIFCQFYHLFFYSFTTSCLTLF